MNKDEKQKKHDKDDWDTGVVIAKMNGDELPKYRRMAYLNRAKRPSKTERMQEKHKYTKKEQRAMIRAGFAAMLPRLLVIIIGFGLAALLVWIWLR